MRTFVLQLPSTAILSSSASAASLPSSVAAERPASTRAMSVTLVSARHVRHAMWRFSCSLTPNKVSFIEHQQQPRAPHIMPTLPVTYIYVYDTPLA